jgi:hypothetical protein
MLRKKLFLLTLILTLILIFGVSITAASCEKLEEGIENGAPVIVGFNVSAETNNSIGEGTVTVNATDSPGNILKYEWSISGGIINNINKNRTTFNVQDLTGTFTIKVKISDQYGGVSEVSIQVAAANQNNQNNQGVEQGQSGAQVKADLTVSSATITSGGVGTVSVNATGYDGNISLLEYDWSISGGTINNVNKNVLTFTAPNDPGTITIKVTISDQSGVVATGSIQVTVAGQGGQSGQDVQIQEGQSGQDVPKPVEEGAFGN